MKLGETFNHQSFSELGDGPLNRGHQAPDQGWIGFLLSAFTPDFAAQKRRMSADDEQGGVKTL